MEKTLVVMAAGMGSRFGGLKQIEPVGPNGEFIIDYAVYDAKRAGFEKIVFVIKKELEEIFKETIGKRVEDKIKVEYAFQEISNVPSKEYLVEKREKPWGTIQAVLSAKDCVPGDFAVINADDFYGYDSYKKAANFLDSSTDPNEYACISYPFNVTSSKFGSVKRGVCYVEGDNIVKVVESSIVLEGDHGIATPLNGGEVFQIPADQPVSMNMFAFKKGFFEYLEEYFTNFFKQEDEVILKSEALLPELVKDKIIEGKITLKNVVSSSKWLGITYREDLDELVSSIQNMIDKGEYPNKLWE